MRTLDDRNGFYYVIITTIICLTLLGCICFISSSDIKINFSTDENMVKISENFNELQTNLSVCQDKLARFNFLENETIVYDYSWWKP